jgi:hypothetical protein
MMEHGKERQIKRDLGDHADLEQNLKFVFFLRAEELFVMVFKNEPDIFKQ